MSPLFCPKEQQKAVTDIVEHLNETLTETPLKGIELLKPNDRTTTLPLFFVRKDKLPNKAGEQGASGDVVKHLTKQKSVYFAYARWGANKFELRNGFIVISSDADDAKKMKHSLLAAIAYELGLMNYSSLQAGSIFYRDGAKRNDAKKLTTKDKQLISWYYNHVPAGSDSIKKPFADHWPKDK